ALLLLLAIADPYRLALPGYKFDFPRDHFNHPEFQTEWWYYTGNLRTPEGRKFGFELTFFRYAVDPSLPKNANVWDVRDVWMAHLALSDIDGGRFLNTERMNRTGPGLAGVDAAKRRIWNGNWSAQWTSPDDQQLRAVADQFAFDLNLHSAKPPVVHGANGVSQKAEGKGRASHYVSLTRLQTKGTITLEGKPYQVEGTAWMDHEFFSHSMEANQSGWDWFSLQFDDGAELMLYRLRRKDGTIEPLSSGTYVDPAGRTRTLKLADFELKPGEKWKNYPVEWTLRVPSLRIDVQVRTRLKNQELAGKYGALPTYWEGAIEVSGSHRGVGYLEMTGYAGALRMD
ncbi:MAG: lipocalin-like domain-containing protein, partial [Bryobacteraceae bacterium]|nr:lipocalin-like domain-containing protein [Bryobacteraceae bacterium]